MAANVNDGVKGHSTNTAGGRIRFSTDSQSVVIKVKTDKNSQMFHATPLMESGFDLYIDGLFESVYAGVVKPAFGERAEYEFEIQLPAGEKDITVNMPQGFRMSPWAKRRRCFRPPPRDMCSLVGRSVLTAV